METREIFEVIFLILAFFCMRYILIFLDGLVKVSIIFWWLKMIAVIFFAALPVMYRYDLTQSFLNEMLISFILIYMVFWGSELGRKK